MHCQLSSSPNSRKYRAGAVVLFSILLLAVTPVSAQTSREQCLKERQENIIKCFQEFPPRVSPDALNGCLEHVEKLYEHCLFGYPITSETDADLQREDEAIW